MLRERKVVIFREENYFLRVLNRRPQNVDNKKDKYVQYNADYLVVELLENNLLPAEKEMKM